MGLLSQWRERVAWLKRPLSERRTPPAIRLPWWGQLLTSQNKRVLQALLESGQRLAALMQHPGWQDAEAVLQDWIARYAEQAGRLGQQVEDQQGRMVLREVDTPEDDRRRLIAAAQAAALRGYFAELKQRASANDLLLARHEQERKEEPSEDRLV